jgi:ABC-type multidrug transport system fused ATPase/permease subunit
MINPKEGRVMIGSQNITDMNFSDLKRIVSYVPQNTTRLFNKTIYQNIIYGSEDTPELRKEIINILRKYSISNIFYQINQNIVHENNTEFNEFLFLDYDVGKNGSLLSGGQKQTIHIIRSFLNKDARIIILDEPTTALDNNSKQNILRLIKDINSQNKTILIISHDKDVQNNYCKKSLVFSNNDKPKLVS